MRSWRRMPPTLIDQWEWSLACEVTIRSNLAGWSQNMKRSFRQRNSIKKLSMKEHGIFDELWVYSCPSFSTLYLSILPKVQSAYKDLLGIISCQISPFLYFLPQFLVTLHLCNCDCFSAAYLHPWSFNTGWMLVGTCWWVLTWEALHWVPCKV